MFRIITLSLFILLSLSIVQAQEKIQNLALSIVDTGNNDYFQAKQIYDWVTSNIDYDLKSFKSFEMPGYSVSDILRNQKGVCSEFSLIFSELCNSIGIETYIVSGYTKGFSYYKGMPFLKADHSWAIFYADSAWHFADPTLGAGYVFLKASAPRVFLKKITGIHAPKNKVKFMAEKDDSWFDIPVDTLVKTHYPLEPAWFNTENPYSYLSFVLDSALYKEPYPNYKDQFNQLLGKDKEHVLLQEGISGNIFNPYNYFDLANGFWAVSLTYDIQREIKESNKWQFEKYSEDYQTILYSIQKYLAVHDSVYKIRQSELKKLFSDQKRIVRKVESKAKSAKGSFKSGKQSILGKSATFRKKQESYLLRAERAKLKYLPNVEVYDTIKTNPEKIRDLYNEFSDTRIFDDSLAKKADSLFSIIDKKIAEDTKLDDSIEFSNYLFAGIVHDLIENLEQLNEEQIKTNVDSLILIYREIGNLLARKKGSKSIMQEKSKDYYSYANLLQGSLKKQSELLNKLYRETNCTDSIKVEHTNVLNDLIHSYRQSMKYTGKLDQHNLLQTDENKINLKALKYQRKAIKTENRLFNAWYNNLYLYHHEKYEHEKLMAKTIRNYAQKNKRLVDSKLKKYNLILEKSENGGSSHK